MANEFGVAVHEYVPVFREMGIELYKSAGTPTANGPNKAALCIDTTNAKLYINTGTASSATWNDVGAISADEISLAQYRFLEGNGSGVGAASDNIRGVSGVNGVAIGDGAATAVLQSNGDFDLRLQTGNATTSTFTIADGANGNMTAELDGSGTFVVNSQNAGATGAQLALNHQSASPAPADVVAQLYFAGADDGSNSTNYARLDGVIDTVTDTLEDGHLSIYAMVAGTETELVDVGSNGTVEFFQGLMSTAEQVTPHNDSGAASTISVGTTAVDVQAVTNDANDWIVLPSLSSVPVGHEITICNNAGGNFELRTPATSGEKINTVDSDGTNELLMTDTEVVKVIKVSDTDGWMARSFTALGADNAALVPDA